MNNDVDNRSIEEIADSINQKCNESMRKIWGIYYSLGQIAQARDGVKESS